MPKMSRIEMQFWRSMWMRGTSESHEGETGGPYSGDGRVVATDA